MKVCSKCKACKPLDEFFARKGATDGKMSCCKVCKTKMTYAWRDINREKWNEYVLKEYSNSQRRKRKLEKARLKAEAKKKYLAQNEADIKRERQRKAEARPTTRAYRKAFRSTDEYKARARDRRAKKQANDPGYRLSRRMSSGIGRSLRLKKGGKTWQSFVNYTLADLIKHIERQFSEGMSWDNIGEWHVDHILPLSSFRFSSEDDEDFRAAWAITNLRPMWAEDNLKKHAKVLTLI